MTRRPARAAPACCSAAAFAVCAAPCIGTVLAVDARARERHAATSPSGVVLLARLLARARRRVHRSPGSRSRARWARSAGCATATTLIQIAERPDAGRARPAALLPPRLVAPRRAEPGSTHRPDEALTARAGDAAGARSEARGLESSEPAATAARSTCASTAATVDAAVRRARTGRAGAAPSRAGARAPTRPAAAGLVPGDGDVDEPLEEVALRRRRPHARRARAPRAPRRSAAATARGLSRSSLERSTVQRTVLPSLPSGHDPALWGRSLLPGEARGAAARAPPGHGRPHRRARSRDRRHRARRPGRRRRHVSRRPDVGFTNHTDTAGLRARARRRLRPGASRNRRSSSARSPRRRRDSTPRLPFRRRAAAWRPAHDLHHRRTLHRHQRPLLRGRVSRGLHPRGRPHPRHRPRRVHRLRRLRARVPGRGDLPRGRAPRQVERVRRDQLRLPRGHGRRERARSRRTRPRTTSTTSRSNRH